MNASGTTAPRLAALVITTVATTIVAVAYAAQDQPTPPTDPATVTTPQATTDALSDTPRPSDAPASAENNILAGEITPELTLAVDRGLAFLATQQADDGSFDAGRFGKNVAIASLAGIAFMADGHLPGRGEYSGNVERALDFILSSSGNTG
ncbi:MAG: hypothetical protein AAF235_04680, partial [Planctomycetota bacterium]